MKKKYGRGLTVYRWIEPTDKKWKKKFLKAKSIFFLMVIKFSGCFLREVFLEKVKAFFFSFCVWVRETEEKVTRKIDFSPPLPSCVYFFYLVWRHQYCNAKYIRALEIGNGVCFGGKACFWNPSKEKKNTRCLWI